MQALFRRAQLKALVDIHSTEFQSEGLGGGYLSPEEINIIRGALDMTEKKAFVGMTPLDKVWTEFVIPNVLCLPFSSLMWSIPDTRQRATLPLPHIVAPFKMLNNLLSSVHCLR